MIVSVIIPAYNAAGRIGVCLAALRQQRLPQTSFEVIVVDDGSTDATAAISEGFGAQVIRQVNQGPAVARNMGAKAARGSILLFTDDDCEPDPHFLEEMLRPMQEDPSVIGVQGRYRTRQQAFAARFIQTEIEERYEKMAQFDSIDFIGTYAAAYRREVFLRHGGFDARYRQASGEDIDLSFRLHGLGYRMVFQPNAIIYHTHPATMGHLARTKFKRGYWHIRLGRAHPQRMVKNSYAPRSLALQVVSIPLLLLALLALPFHDLAGVFILALLLMFVWQSRTMMRLFDQNGFTRKWLIPFGSMVRAAALCAGMIRGVLGLVFRGE